MTSRWWRAYDEAVDDPKLQTLPPATAWGWFNLMCLASANSGILPDINHIAFKLRISIGKVETLIATLRERGLIDQTEAGLQPHNWNARQFKSDVSTERVKQFRKRQKSVSETNRNVSSTNGETPPYTESDSETEAEKKEERARGALVASDWPTDYREQFWQAFPNKVGKADALAKLERIKKCGTVAFGDLMAGLERYVRKTDDRPWCNPATWINQQRWTDQPATVPRQQSVRDQQQQRSDDALDELRAHNRSRDQNGGKTPRLLSEGSGERPEDLHRGAGRDADELPGLDLPSRR